MTVFFLILAAIIIGGILEALLLFFWIPFLREHHIAGRNYSGETIPVSVGLSFAGVMLLTHVFFLMGAVYREPFLLFLFGLLCIAFLGFIDDLLGQRDTLGFRGHFGALFKGRLTTGGLKAIGGGGVALFIALLVSSTWWEVVLHTLIIALFTNLLNLLDLRPGRAIKGFLFFMLLLLAGGLAGDYILMAAPLLGAVLLYFPRDLRGQTMLGDSGSNVLGYTVGFLCIMHYSLLSKGLLLLFLLALHVYTEKHSLSVKIEENAVLRWLDHLGRGR